MVPKPFIEHVARLVNLSERDRRIVSSLPVSLMTVKRHRDLLSSGERPDYLYTVVEGWAGRYAIRADGSRRITGFMLPGDFCSMHAVCRQAMDHSITALTDCLIAHIAVSDIEKAIAEAPTLDSAIRRVKLIDEAMLRTWLVNNHDAVRMLAHLICELHARTIPDISTGPSTLNLPITQEHVADALGITPVHINRMFRKLREEKLITFSGRIIDIPDIKALHRRANFDPSYLRATSNQ